MRGEAGLVLDVHIFRQRHQRVEHALAAAAAHVALADAQVRRRDGQVHATGWAGGEHGQLLRRPPAGKCAPAILLREHGQVEPAREAGAYFMHLLFQDAGEDQLSAGCEVRAQLRASSTSVPARILAITTSACAGSVPAAS